MNVLSLHQDSGQYYCHCGIASIRPELYQRRLFKLKGFFSRIVVRRSIMETLLPGPSPTGVLGAADDVISPSKLSQLPGAGNKLAPLSDQDTAVTTTSEPENGGQRSSSSTAKRTKEARPHDEERLLPRADEDVAAVLLKQKQREIDESAALLQQQLLDEQKQQLLREYHRSAAGEDAKDAGLSDEDGAAVREFDELEAERAPYVWLVFVIFTTIGIGVGSAKRASSFSFSFFFFSWSSIAGTCACRVDCVYL